MLRVSGASSVSCCRFQLVRFHEVSLDWFPWIIVFKFCFVFFSVLRLRTTDCLVFCSFIKDCVYYPFAFGSFHSHCDNETAKSRLAQSSTCSNVYIYIYIYPIHTQNNIYNGNMYNIYWSALFTIYIYINLFLCKGEWYRYTEWWKPLLQTVSIKSKNPWAFSLHLS